MWIILVSCEQRHSLSSNPSPEHPVAGSMPLLIIFTKMKDQRRTRKWGNIPSYLLVVATLLNLLLCLGRIPSFLLPTSPPAASSSLDELIDQRLLRQPQAGRITPSKQSSKANAPIPVPERKASVVSSAVNDSGATEECQVEYIRATAGRTQGLTPEDMRRGWTYSGNRHRLERLANKLHDREQRVTAITLGGSITLGHGVRQQYRYSNRLEKWMNDMYPLKNTVQQHQVLNLGCHGANICAMAKRIDIVLGELPADSVPDLFVLEFAVNDYEGRDHQFIVGYETDTFFDGFRDIATCTEVALHKLLTRYPNAAVLFVEMQTGVVGRKTAAVLHMGAAQHYQVPVLDYGQVINSGYLHLLSVTREYNFSAPQGDSILPYPHGCHPCLSEHMTDQFRKNGCRTLCLMQRFFNGSLDCTDQTMSLHNRMKCSTAWFAHDAVHPSGVGHQVVTDLIVEAVSNTRRLSCLRQGDSNELVSDLETKTDTLHGLGWMVRNPKLLDQQYSFLWVNDTYKMFTKRQPLSASKHSAGFSLYDDKFDRTGWITTNATAEAIQFEIDLPRGGCYVPYLSVLKSYENMGSMTVTVADYTEIGKEHSIDIDSLWEPRISVPNDIQLVPDSARICAGHCRVTVNTHPQHQDRGGNKIKIITLSVRKCVDDKLG